MADWDMTAVGTRLNFNASETYHPRVQHIEDNFYKLTYVSNGNVVNETLEVNLSTWEVTKKSTTPYNSTTQMSDSLYFGVERVAGTDYFVNSAYWGNSRRRWIDYDTLTFDANYNWSGVATADGGRNSGGKNSTLIAMDTNHILSVYEYLTGAEGRARILTINESTGGITLEALLSYETTNDVNDPVVVKLDANHVLVLFSPTISGYFEGTVLHVNTSTWAVTQVGSPTTIESGFTARDIAVANLLGDGRVLAFTSEGASSRMSVYLLDINTSTGAITVDDTNATTGHTTIGTGGQGITLGTAGDRVFTAQTGNIGTHSGNVLSVTGDTIGYDVSQLNWETSASYSANDGFGQCQIDGDDTHFLTVSSCASGDSGGLAQIIEVEVPTGGGGTPEDAEPLMLSFIA